MIVINGCWASQWYGRGNGRDWGPAQTGSVVKVSVIGISSEHWDSFVFSHYKL